MMLTANTVNAQKRFVFMPQWTAQAQFAGYYVAMEKGFYKAEGIDVDIVKAICEKLGYDLTKG